MKAIYSGAGIDLKPIKYFPEITEFVYIDCQPFSEFGIQQCGIIMKSDEFGKYDGFSRPGFIPKLEKKMEKYKMKLVSVDGNERIYKNDTQTIRYLINTSFPEHYEYIKSKNPYFDTIIISGHSPNSKLMDFAKGDILFIGSSGTCFSASCESVAKFCDKTENCGYYKGHPGDCGWIRRDKNEFDYSNTIIDVLHTDTNFQHKFNKFCYINYKTGEKYMFDTWDDYYENYKKKKLIP